MNNKYLEFFKGIINQSSVAKSTLKNKTPELIEIDNQFNSLLNADVLDICAEMEVNGYQISSQQKKLLQEKIYKQIINDPYQYPVFKAIYGDLDFEFKAKILLNSPHPYSNIYEKMEDDFKDENFKKNLIDYLCNHLKETSRKLPQKVSISKYMRGNISMEEKSTEIMNNFVDEQSRINKIVSDYYLEAPFEKLIEIKNLFIEVKDNLEKMRPMIKTRRDRGDIEVNQKRVLRIYSTERNIEDITKIISQRKDIAKPQIINNLRLKNLENGVKQEIVHKYSISDLPQETKNLIKDIEQSYQKSKGKNIMEIQLDMDRKLQDIQSIVTKFMAIDKDYRDTLKNIEGKSPFDLMMNSLGLIKQDFDKIYQDNNQTLVNDLSALNRKATIKKLA